MARNLRFFSNLKSLRILNSTTRFCSVFKNSKNNQIDEFCSTNFRKIQRRNFERRITNFEVEEQEVEEEELDLEAKEIEEEKNDKLEADKSVVSRRLFAEFLRKFVEEKTSNDQQFSQELCRQLRSAVIKNESQKSALKIGERSIDIRILQTLMNENFHDVVLAYVKFLDENNLFNPASAILTAEILYKLRKDQLVDESYVLRFYDAILKPKYASFFKISPMIQLFCLAPTSRFAEALKIVENSTNLKKNAHCYFMLAACLIEQNRFREAMDFLDKFKNLDLIVPDTSPYTAAFHESILNFILKQSSSLSDVKKSEIFSNFVRYVDLLYDIRCSGIPSDLNHVIGEIFQNLNKNFKVDTSQIVDGRCTNCDQKMENEELTGEDFELMRRQVLHNLIKGDDVFRQSSPVEMQIFLRFVERNKPFDLVFDSLNLAFVGLGRKMLPKDRPLRLAKTIRQFKEFFRAKKACVIARKHFFRDNDTGFAQISKMANLYLLDDKSYDDPFILYAALSSGRNCYVISKDVYSFLNDTLDPKTRSLFLRWRRTRLITDFHVSVAGVPSITTPPTFSVRCQRSGDHFHLPLIDRGDIATSAPTSASSSPSLSRAENRVAAVSPSSWLCIGKK